jgi:beta-N-acetylhexosaminidase
MPAMPWKLFSMFILFFLLGNQVSQAQPANKKYPLPKLISPATSWVDSIYNSLSIEQRIGQLFMVAAYSGTEKFNQPLIEKLIKENQIGGVIFMQGNASDQATLTNLYQSNSKVPLLVAMDAEWGLGMRLTGIRDLPRQLMMGAMTDSTIVYRVASFVANQCQRLGVHVDFAPVVDVNNNPNNPVINFRSFGEDKNKVSNYGIQYMRGLQDHGIMACAKHFPGHGDTDVDSHKDLPEIKKTISQLEDLEFYPFKKLIANGIQSIMVAHLQIPAIDNRINTPTTLSDKAITTLLKQKMGFDGLIFTDALNMQGIAKYYNPGEIDLKAFEAGNDVLLFSQNVPDGLQKIKAALDSGKITSARLEESVKKILMAKYNAGLWNRKDISTEHIDEDINELTAALRKQVAEAAITLLNDKNQVLNKVKRNTSRNIVYIGVGTSSENIFSQRLKKYGVNTILFAPTNPQEFGSFISQVKSADAIIVGIHNLASYPKSNFGLDNGEIEMINSLMKTNKAISVLFGNPYAAKNFCESDGLLIAYDEADETQEAAAMIVTGQLKAKGKLPVSVCDKFQFSDGIVGLTTSLGESVDDKKFNAQNKTVVANQTKIINNKLSSDIVLECCVSPNALGINNEELNKLDNYLANAVQSKTFPGCRVLAAQDGKVFYDKSFGYLKDDKKNSVSNNTIYDIASVTKVASTTMAVMKLYDEGKLDLNANLGRYVAIVRGTDKEYLKIRDILMHQAGLKSWIPFYKETLDSNKLPRADIYSKTKTIDYSIKVAPTLFMRKQWIDTMWNRILYSSLENRGKYVYSDLDFIFMQKVVESITKKQLDDYVTDEFYKPLGMTNTRYEAYKTLSGKDIAPSEYDDYFRYQTIQGYVHDMGAAMFGGVSGHAGLFSTAEDLGILFQMLLNGGIYKGHRYFKRATVDLFTDKNSAISRRGLGFDKPEPNPNKGTPCANNASLSSFGHQGFTGTCVWVDPTNKLVFVFLSNRTYPSSDNKAINRSGGVRENAQQYIYKAMGIAAEVKR